jgi:hypothetical protein
MRQLVIDTETTGLDPFTVKDEMKAFLKRRRGTFTSLLIYKIRGDGQDQIIMTMSRADGRMIGGRARDWESHAPLPGPRRGYGGSEAPRVKPQDTAEDRSYLHVRPFAP